MVGHKPKQESSETTKAREYRKNKISGLAYEELVKDGPV